jgi:1,4-alpha-glucan branching enzyme
VITPEDEHRSLVAIRDALCYRYNDDAFDRVIYSESHDEVASGKARVPQEVNPKDPKGWYSQKRLTLAAAMVFTAPGIPMLFQGQEFLEGEWFRDTVPIDWDQRDEFHGIVRLYRDLIRLRLNRDGFTRGLCGQFTQVHHLHDDRKVLAYHRWDKGRTGGRRRGRRQLPPRAAGWLRHRLPVRRNLEAPFQQRLAGLQRRLRRSSEHQRGH